MNPHLRTRYERDPETGLLLPQHARRGFCEFMNTGVAFLGGTGGGGGGGATDPYFSSVSLLLHMDGANNGTTFTDSSSSAKTITPQVNAKTSTAQSMFGGSSLLLDGNGASTGTTNQSALTFTVDASVTFGTGDFTIEAWVYNKVTPTTFSSIIDFRPYAGNGAYPLLYVTSTNSVAFFVNSGEAINGGSIPLNTWTFVALSKSSGVTKLFVGGTQAGISYTDSNSYSVSTTVSIGRSANNPYYGGLNGHIDDMRITKGIARYTANFTPPTAAFPNS